MPRSLETSPTQTARPRSAQEKKPAADRRIRDMVPEDKENFLSMVRMFYQSPAVESAVDEQHFETTFHAALSHSPYIRILMLEDKVEGVELIRVDAAELTVTACVRAISSC